MGGALWFGLALTLAVANRWSRIEAIGMLVFSLGIAAVMALYLVRYRAGDAPIMVFRPYSVIAALLSILSLALTLFVMLLCLGASIHMAGWGKLVSVGFGLAWVAYLQLLRAAALHRASAGRDARRLRGLFA